jgi:hypothetical protein
VSTGLLVGNKSLESVELFKYLERDLTNRKSIHGDIKSRLKSKNGCYHSVKVKVKQCRYRPGVAQRVPRS